jgi:hypothetical protein
MEGSAVEVELRLGQFMSKQTGERFDYGQCSSNPDLLYAVHRSHRWKVHRNHRSGVPWHPLS